MKNSLLSKHAKSFNWAGFFLPKKTYENCSILYDFCRTIDDIVDNDEKEIDQKQKDLSKFENEFLSGVSQNKIISNMHRLMKNNEISEIVVKDLFDGIKYDLGTVKIKSYNELYFYCYRVAGTVGIMMAKILGIKDKESLNCATSLGIAMQLTNIVRDVYEDAKMKRLYLPSEIDDYSSLIYGQLHPIDDIDNIFPQEKIKQENIIENNNHLWRSRLDMIFKSSIFYNFSYLGIKKINLKNRFGIILALNLYRGIGDKIIKKKKRIGLKEFKERTSTNLLEKFIITIKSFYQLIQIEFFWHSFYENKVSLSKHTINSEKFFEKFNNILNLNERF